MFYVSAHALITFWTAKLKHFTRTEIVKLKSEKPIGPIATTTQTYRS